ncbi:MAG TPA: hypothetical protein VF712_15670 [Thermoleophilaceae bacterium]
MAGAGVAGVVAAAAALLFGRVPLSFDTYFALVDGRDLAHGRTPDLELGVAATPHPLFEAAAALLAPLGGGAEPALWVLVLLSFGAAVVAAYELARLLGGALAGALVAVLLVTRPVLLEVSARASVDVPALALVLWALALELRRPRRGTAVLVLLALAGLLRPEAWLMAGAYWVWAAWPGGPGERVRLGALAAAAPLLWVLHDLILTGDPLFTRDHTADTVAGSYKTGVDGLAEVPRHVGSILGVAGCVAALAGAGLAWVVLRGRAGGERADRERLLILVAALVLGGVAAVALAAGGQPILQRFFLLPAAVLLVLGAAAAGRLAAAARRGRRPAGAGALLGLALLALVPVDVPRIAGARSELRADQRFQDELRDLVDGGPARSAIEDCRPVHLTAGGVLPTLAFALDVPARDLAAAPPGRASVATTPAASDEDLPYPLAPPAPAPSGQSEVARSRSWAVYRGCP